MKKLFFVLFLLSAVTTVWAQDKGQVVRGRVTDLNSKFPLIGATVMVTDVQPVLGAATEADGNFKIEKVPVGRHTLQVSYQGYHPRVLTNILVSAGKEQVLELELEEQVVKMQEVVISASKGANRGLLNNEMALLSARTFNPEEAARYAGSRNDPARMASNYAGVSGANDSRNDIIIRGNSPAGLLWRLEGVDIPNPSHFGTLSTTGGPVSMLNNNLLGKSDFLTGAFPAEYGNAIAGVFDLQLRRGNNEKREYTGQIGFNGFELGAEGPFSKNYHGSYLVNYRYSVLGVFKTLGISVGTGSAVPEYQDLAFNLDLPTENRGRFSVFGTLGKSNISFINSQNDAAEKDLYSAEGYDTYAATKTGIIGLTHRYFFNNDTYGKLSVAAAGIYNNLHEDSITLESKSLINIYNNQSTQNRYTIAYLLNRKFNSRNTFTTGINLDRLTVDYDEEAMGRSGEFIPVRNTQGGSYLYRGHAQWQHRFSDDLTLNAGMHFMHFSLNNRTAVEPRLSMRWQFTPGRAFAFGVGIHNQLQVVPLYFNKEPTTGAETNRNLDFTRSRQLVMGYDQALTENIRLKAEAYYQHLDQVPVEQKSSAFSMLNAGATFDSPDEDSLVNNGRGRNYGLELTLERYYENGYYFLFTTSLFDSKYKGSDGVWRNTAFNGNYIFNLLAGREFNLKKNRVLGFDFKVMEAGGRRYTPILLAESSVRKEVVYDEAQSFAKRYYDYFRLDAKVSFRRNGKKTTQEWSVDVQNITNRKNIFTQSYNRGNGQLQTEYQLGLFPNVQYKIQF